MVPGKKNDVAIAGGQILGDEYSDHVVKVCVFSLVMCEVALTLSPTCLEPKWHHLAREVRSHVSPLGWPLY